MPYSALCDTLGHDRSSRASAAELTLCLQRTRRSSSEPVVMNRVPLVARAEPARGPPVGWPLLTLDVLIGDSREAVNLPCEHRATITVEMSWSLRLDKLCDMHRS